MDRLHLIAQAMGYHFWRCQSDEDAIQCGLDCAKEIESALYDQEIEEKKEETIDGTTENS